MSLIKCPECKKKFSDKSSKCPNCNYPISKKEIKDILVQNEKRYNAYKKRKISTIQNIRLIISFLYPIILILLALIFINKTINHYLSNNIPMKEIPFCEKMSVNKMALRHSNLEIKCFNHADHFEKNGGTHLIKDEDKLLIMIGIYKDRYGKLKTDVSYYRKKPFHFLDKYDDKFIKVLVTGAKEDYTCKEEKGMYSCFKYDNPKIGFKYLISENKLYFN